MNSKEATTVVTRMYAAHMLNAGWKRDQPIATIRSMTLSEDNLRVAHSEMVYFTEPRDESLGA